MPAHERDAAQQTIPSLGCLIFCFGVFFWLVPRPRGCMDVCEACFGPCVVAAAYAAVMTFLEACVLAPPYTQRNDVSCFVMSLKQCLPDKPVASSM